jgi:hypothetical protein
MKSSESAVHGMIRWYAHWTGFLVRGTYPPFGKRPALKPR